LKIPKVSNKTQNLRTLEGFSQVFRLILRFWNMSEVVYEKNGVLLLFNVIFLHFKVNFYLVSINSRFGSYCCLCSGLLH
jgi:hypothetical protein